MKWLGCVRLIAALCVVSFVATADGDATSEDRTADDWRDAAMSAALAGDREGYADALHAAIKADPDHAPARADRGEVRVDGRWLPVPYAQHLASEDERLGTYEKLRSEASDTAADHARLAHWCDRQGLTDEARPHWLMVLKNDPTNTDALKGLNAEWRDGKLWDVDLAEAADEATEARDRSAKSWEGRFRRFERRPYIHEEALAAIRSEIDAGAVRPIERRVFALAGDPNGSAEATHKLVEAFFDACERMPEVEVTASLSRMALAAGEGLRAHATDVLRTRPQVDVMPLLLSALIAPIDSTHQITRDRQGNVTYRHEISREGVDRDYQHERNRTATVSVGVTNAVTPGFRTETSNETIYLALIQARFEGLKNQIAFQTEAGDTDASITAHNRTAAAINERVVEVLTRMSGQSAGDEPRAWWEYWRRYTGYDAYDRPIERTYEVSQKRDYVVATPTLIRLPPPPPRPRHECFVAGTPVWTKEDKQAIETLKRGDLVLARDPHRGGLTYRVVLERTTRRPSPMVEIVAGDETIHSTEGHPFWVIGQGWTMAKQLAEGDVLSTVSGPVAVVSVAEFEDREAFNLVVEGAANYYVGASGVLVHDNTPRRPAVGLVATR